MSDDRKDLPPVTAPNFLEKVREALSTYLGNRGNALDRGVTLRDLTDAGVVQLTDQYQANRRGSPVAGVGSSVAEAIANATYVADLSMPPTPSGFTATAAISNLLVECGAQTYSAGHGHAKARLYGSTLALPVFANAVLLSEFQGTVASYATNPATTWRLWLTWVSVDGVESLPAGGTNGVAVTTGQNVALLLTALSGQIAATELATSLNTRINLIDTPTTGLVTKVGDLQTTYGSTASSAANAAAAANSASNAAANAAAAVNSASNAAASDAAAILAKSGAQVASADAVTAQAAAASSQAAALLAQTGAVTAKDQAVTAKTNAETAAGSASTSATNASISATGAAGSASSASTSATTAAGSATAAGNSATAAGTSATTASTSATNAGTSATAANTAKVAAESARDAASGSASAAATSASTATTKATDAGTSAATATTAANTATTQAGAASTSATNAATSATGAAGSASSAASSSTTAASSKDAAAVSAGTASTKAGEASTSATNAATSATNAAGSASSASTSATTAAGSATAAGNSATAAGTSATTASTSATNAGTSATAANTAKVAAESARDAASGSASAAATSASTATTKATDAGTSAATATTAANTATTQAGAASTSATNAATSATGAAGSASSATNSATTAANSATAAGGSATAAGTSATNASTSATAAGNSATSASGSAVSAQSSFGLAVRLSGNWFFSEGKTGWSQSSTSYAETDGTILSGASNSVTGGASLRFAGDRWAYWDKRLPVQLARRYRVRFRVRNVGGTPSIIYAGVATYDSTGAVEYTGVGTHRYCAASGVTVPADSAWYVYEGVITGGGAGSMNEFRTTTAFASPMFIVNYTLVNGGICDVDECSIEDVTESVAAAGSAAAAATSASTATTQATNAGTSATAANTSALNASTSAGGAVVSAAAAALSESNASGSASTATTQAGLATTAKNAAGVSQAAAGVSASNAATSETNASGSASTAATQAGLATAAKDAAGLSQTAAGVSASNAATSASNASGSASTATTQAGLATTANNNAGTSAAAALVSQNAAATSASNASGSASTATTQAGIATTANNNAGTSAAAALVSQNAAATSASNASGSASTATTQAGIATTAKDAAGVSQTAAGVSASNSATSAVNAAGSATSAATALTNVQATVRGTSLGLPLAQWVLGSQTIVTVSDGKVGTSALRLAPGSYPNQGTYIAIDPTKKYRARFWARPVSTTNGLLYFSLQQFTNDTGTTGPVNGGRSPYKPSGQSRASHNATYGTDAWGEYSYVWDAADWQAGVKFFRPDFLDNYSGNAGYWEVQDFTLNEVTALETNYAAIQTEATTRATQTGNLFAQYSVKLDVNGYVSGFGLSSTLNNAAPYSQFIFKADQFAFGAPGQTSVYPFVIQATATTVNGVAVPAGVYMDAAYIQNGTITNAKIGDATIDSAKIASLTAAKITAGSMQVGSYVQSTSYVAGTSGWSINANGTAEFSGVVVRGTVYATAGSIGGNTIDSTSIRSGQTAFNTGTGFYLGSDGKLSLGNSAGNRMTWDGTNLNVVGGGSFSGTLTAAAVDAVNTINIVGNAVSTSVFASGTGFSRFWNQPSGFLVGPYVDEYSVLTFFANAGETILLEATFSFAWDTSPTYTWNSGTQMNLYIRMGINNNEFYMDTDSETEVTIGKLTAVRGAISQKVLRKVVTASATGTQTLKLSGICSYLLGFGSYGLNKVTLSALIRRR